jgi:uncharacterized protein (DUF302 family)
MKLEIGLQELAFPDVQFAELLSDLTKEIELQNYLITRISHIDNSWQRGTQNFNFKFYKIIEFCNLESCSRMISLEFNMGFFLPSRFLIYQKLDSSIVYVAYQKPTTIARMFNSPELLKFAVKFEKDIEHVLEEISF